VKAISALDQNEKNRDVGVCAPARWQCSSRLSVEI